MDQNQAVLANENTERIQGLTHHRQEADRRGSRGFLRDGDYKKQPLDRLDDATCPRHFRGIAFEICRAHIVRQSNQEESVIRAKMDTFLDEVGKKALRLQSAPGGHKLVQQVKELRFRLRNVGLVIWADHLKRTFRKAGRTTARIGR